MKFILVSQAYAQYEVSQDKNTAILVNVYGDSEIKVEEMKIKLKELGIYGEVSIAKLLSILQYGNVISLMDSIIKI